MFCQNANSIKLFTLSRLLLLSIWTFSLFRTSYAEEPIFVTEILPPLQELKNGTLTGFHVDAIKSAMATTGLKDTPIEIYPWARAYKLALERKNTFIFSMMRTVQRETKFVWVKLLSEESYAFYAAKPAERYTISRIGDARRWRTVALREDLIHQILLRNGFNENHHLFIVSNVDSAFQTFFSGRVELIVSSSEILNVMASKYGYDAERWSPVWEIPELSKGYYLAANINTDPQLIEALRRGFDKQE